MSKRRKGHSLRRRYGRSAGEQSTYKFRIHTGPVIVKGAVTRLHAGGVRDAHAGTEHAYGTLKADTADAAREHLSTAIGWRVRGPEVWRTT